ncbi:MAG: alpha/beta hydrolase [Spirochaetales bacterium]|nr:alpha/beta hydrolase [Spirochaetales bacterium]
MKAFILIIGLIIGLMAGLILVVGLPEFEKPVANDLYRGEFIDIKGDTIRYFQKGQGPDVLLIHGTPGVVEDWETLAKELEKDYRVTAYDRPGQGLSSFQYNPDPLLYNMEIAAGLIKALSLTDVIVIGHSYGGAIALALAVQESPEIKGFVLLSPASFPTGGFKLFDLIAGYPVAGRGLIRIIRGSVIPSLIKNGLNTAFNPNLKQKPDYYYETRINLFIQAKALVSTYREEAFFNKGINSIKQYYGDIKKPVLIIHGESDKVIPLYVSQELNNLIPDSKLVILNETCHMVQYVAPEKIKEEIDAFTETFVEEPQIE